MKKVIASPKAPEAIGPYSQGVDTGDLVFLSGQLGIDGQTGDMQEGLEAQTRQAFKNVAYILEAAGLTLEDIVKVQVFLADIDSFATVNAIYAEVFSEPYPARSAFAVKDLPMGGLVELDVIAKR